MSSTLDQLNQAQQSAVKAPLGPVLVLAGAGSGKTKVLTHRIAYLIEHYQVAPEHILAVTFTNKAAGEMRQRLNSMIGLAGSAQPLLGTFHAIGVRILRQDGAALGLSKNFSILDTDDQGKIFRDILAERGVPKRLSPNMFRSYVSAAKNLLQTPGEMSLGLDAGLHTLVANVYADYQNFLWRQAAVDFDDLLLLPIRLWQAFPDVLAKYKNRWQQVLVDEYQDTNQAQYMFLKLLAENSRQLFVVGDDAQSIYGFRGSNIANILNFEQDYPDAVVVKLEQNYRSTKTIVAAAQHVIRLNAGQKAKDLWTENQTGDPIIVQEVYDGRAEAEFVTKAIIKQVSGDESVVNESINEKNSEGSFSILDHLLKVSGKKVLMHEKLPAEHGPLKDIAVLYRTHAQSRQIEEAFLECGIPYKIVGGVRFYERKEIKDMLAYARVVANPLDVISTFRVINLPARSVGEKSQEQWRKYMNSLEQIPYQPQVLQEYVMQAGLTPRATKGVYEFYNCIATLDELPEALDVPAFLRKLLEITELEAEYQDGTEQGDVRIQNMRELISVAASFADRPWREGLVDFLAEVALMTNADDADRDALDVVTLMTLHSAKGLEFDTVFFIGLEEGLLPHSQSMLDPAELAEEIRLAYVGLTRARRKLIVTYAQTRQMYGVSQSNQPSRILSALPPETIDWRTVGGSGYMPGELHYEDWNE